MLRFGFSSASFCFVNGFDFDGVSCIFPDCDSGSVVIRGLEGWLDWGASAIFPRAGL